MGPYREIKRREVVLDPQESTGEIKRGRWSWTLKRAQERSREGGGAGLKKLDNLLLQLFLNS